MTGGTYQRCHCRKEIEEQVFSVSSKDEKIPILLVPTYLKKAGPRGGMCSEVISSFSKDEAIRSRDGPGKRTDAGEVLQRDIYRPRIHAVGNT
ncbi:Hypothetical predicted protein [Podarcis lilfordi]|uniref:Uncharacterized protein n=1 Tax=Podarcis lilfordi TaxID=74358 RepID=A0AA35KPT1_9SAUR|nr:Hypothetical predicted protein [Podarcis lilfordi]